MNFELIKQEFISLKKEELAYLDNIARTSRIKALTEYEKLQVYRKVTYYEDSLKEVFEKLRIKGREEKLITLENIKNICLEIEVDENFLAVINFDDPEEKDDMLDFLGIDPKSYRIKYTWKDLLDRYSSIITSYLTLIQNGKLIEDPIYIFCGYYDYSEDCYGPCFGETIYGTYENICNRFNDKEEISKEYIKEFEKDKLIIHASEYVDSIEVKKIFNEELLNPQNKTIDDCIKETRNRIEYLNHVRSPEYKEELLLAKINELYKRIKGEFINEEVLYRGYYLNVLREAYKLPNNKIINKEKVSKNGGKNAVIVIGITDYNEYIITFQNRIKDIITAEFVSGFIEDDEDVIEAAKRELKEETGYVSNDLFILDEAYTAPGIENQTTYIVVANSCVKSDEVNVSDTEFLSYGLFSKLELEYLIYNNIMNGSLNKFAYYSLASNTDDCNIGYMNSRKRIYKTKREKTNPLYK